MLKLIPIEWKVVEVGSPDEVTQVLNFFVTTYADGEPDEELGESRESVGWQLSSVTPIPLVPSFNTLLPYGPVRFVIVMTREIHDAHSGREVD